MRNLDLTLFCFRAHLERTRDKIVQGDHGGRLYNLKRLHCVRQRKSSEASRFWRAA